MLLGFSWWLIQRKTWCTIYPGHLVRLRDVNQHEVWTCTSLHLNHTLNPGVPVFTEGRQLVRTTTNVRGCNHRNNSSVTTVTVHNSDWQQEVSDNMETLTIHNTIQPQSERESWPYFTTLKPCHSSPLTKTMSLFDFPMTPGSQSIPRQSTAHCTHRPKH